jgi:Rod binding domain-containing protein
MLKNIPEISFDLGKVNSPSKVDKVASQFESFLWQELLKSSLEPIIENKSFSQQIYWSNLISVLAQIMAEKDQSALKEEIVKFLSNSK